MEYILCFSYQTNKQASKQGSKQTTRWEFLPQNQAQQMGIFSRSQKGDTSYPKTKWRSLTKETSDGSNNPHSKSNGERTPDSLVSFNPIFPL
jgi:hypothetical protein